MTSKHAPASSASDLGTCKLDVAKRGPSSEREILVGYR
jgi:hypothetical protein